MNRLLPGVPSMPVSEPAPAASQAPGPIPGQKAYMQAQARELGVPVRGTKAEIWQRIAAKQGENVGRRVRAPREPANALMAQEAPAAAPDPFDEKLAEFEAFLRSR